MTRIKIDQILLSSVLGSIITGIFGLYTDITGLYGSGGIWLSGLISAFVIFFCIYNLASIVYEKIKRFLYSIFFFSSIISGIILFVFLGWGVNLMITADLKTIPFEDLIVILMISIIISLTAQVILFSTGKNEKVKENNNFSSKFILIVSIVWGIILTITFFSLIIQGLAYANPDNDSIFSTIILLLMIPLIAGFIASLLMIWLSIKSFRSFSGTLIYFIHNGFIFGFIICFIFDIVIIEPISMLYELQNKINHGIIAGLFVSAINGTTGYAWKCYAKGSSKNLQ